MSVGFIGVGAIAHALVDALLNGDPGKNIEIVLSPRSNVLSAELAATYTQVRVAQNNQEVAASANHIFLTVRPDQVAEVCADIAFRQDHIVVSAAAGWSPTLLRDHVLPAETVCQMIPLPMVRHHTGPIVLYPRIRSLEELLDGCGAIVVPNEEEDIFVFNCASAAVSTFFEFQVTIVEWMRQRGLDMDVAKSYVTALFQGLSLEAAEADPSEFSRLPIEHETVGGLNEYVREALAGGGTFTALPNHLDHLYQSRTSL